MSEYNKENMVEDIKKWINLDNELNLLQTQIKDKKNNKKLITERLVNSMKQNEVECLNINGGSLLLKKQVSKKPINQQFLLSTLQTYFKDNNINVNELTEYIFENREQKIQESIKRKIN